MEDVFNKLGTLEQKCPHCHTILDFGENTEYDDAAGTLVCMGCENPL